VIDSGVYQLLIKLPHSANLTVGKLREIVFQKGFYIYTGSAKRNLFHRLNRHFSQDKTFHWHIDYLLSQAEILSYNYQLHQPALECELNQRTKIFYSESEFILGFGCSDCGCSSHLIYLPII